MKAELSGTSYVRVGPGRIRVRIVGEGPPLLLIMGLGGNLNMWQPLVDGLPDRQLIMFDFPGTGRSDPGWLPPTMGFNALIVRMLIRKLGFQQLDVLGYSWGGVLAQHLAIQHPGVINHLILASTTPGLGGLPPGPIVMSRMLTPRRYYSAKYFTKIAPGLYGGRYRRGDTCLEDEVKRRVGHAPSILGYASQLTSLAGYSTLPGLPLLRSPTLIISGDDDPIVPKLNPRLIATFIPHSILRIIPGAGHLLLFESTELVVPMIEEFLGPVASGSSVPDGEGTEPSPRAAPGRPAIHR